MSSYYEKFADGKVVCIDEETPFEIPNGWEWCRLGEISTYAQTKRKINASNADTQLWELDLEDIEKGGRLLNIKTVGERKAIGDKTVFNRGDILYSKLRPYLLKILVAPEGGICTPEIIPFTCYGNICKDYIVSFLKSPYVDDYINSATFGVKMPRVSTETMTSLLVPLPPLSEQFRIDTRIKELMPYIDEYGKAQDKLNKLIEELSNTIRKSILQEAIQGKLVPQIAVEGTAQELLEQIKIEKQKLVKEGKLKKSALNDSVIFRGDDNKYCEKIGESVQCIDEEIPFEIPESWVWVRLENCISLLSGRDLEPSQYNDNKRGFPYITGASNFKKGTLYVNRWTNSPITIATKGSLLLTCKGTIGAMAFNNIGAIHIARQVMAIEAYLINLQYIRYYLQFNINALEKNANSMIPGISRNTILKMLFPLPPLAEQKRIVEKVNQLTQLLK
ncbi:MAG: restriction endonuclease subunit S [Prevotella sp.]|nr:restriction endonuclease subunit S [Bacteroidales bacterium]MDY4230050.1 restriction endonuclease subunit S [Prevotella sp.]